jgi:hypothetical protein
MKTTWAKRELRMRPGGFRAAVHQLYKTIESRYAAELAGAGLFKRMLLRYRIAKEFKVEMRKEVEL